MATPEIKHFSEALTALSNSAMGVVKDMDQRITASRNMADDLNAITSHNKHIIERQICLVQSLLEHNAAAQKEMKVFQDELRLYATGRSGASDSVYSKAGQKSQSYANDFNLPPLGEVLDKIRTDHGDTSNLRRSISDSGIPYLRSHTVPRSHPEPAPIHPPALKIEGSKPRDHSSIKRRRQSDDELQSPSSKPRYEAPAGA